MVAVTIFAEKRHGDLVIKSSWTHNFEIYVERDWVPGTRHASECVWN